MEMTIILCICLMGVIGFTLLIRNKDVLSPTFLSGVVFLLGSFAVALRQKTWGVEINGDIVILIIGALISMLIGELLCISLFNKIHSTTIYKGNLVYYNINKRMIAIEVFVGFILAIVYWRYIKSLAAVSGGKSGNILWEARVSMLSGNSAAGTFINIAKTIIIMFSIFCIYIYINNSFFEKLNHIKRGSLYILLPLIPSILLIVFDTGRTEFIRLISISFVGYVLFYKYFFCGFSFGKFVKKGIAFFVAVILVFWIVGSISNKNGSYTMIDNLAKYIGSGIAGFSEIYESGIQHSSMFGESTFRGIRQTLSIVYPSIKTSSNVLSFVRFADGEMTNIYTSIYEYYKDFGMLGVLLIYFFQGLFLTYLYKKAKSKGPGIWALLFMFYSYAIFRQITAADFLTTYFGITHIIAFLTLFISYKLCVTRSSSLIKDGE